MDKKSLGEYGEKIAGKFLTNRGYQIIEKNFHAQGGEIDLITKKDNIWIMIEVKIRSSDKFGTAKSAVNKAKFLKMQEAIRDFFLKKLELPEIPDFKIEVLAFRKNGEKIFYEHIKNIGEDCF